MMPEKLSCVLIVRNEERRIERCLQNLVWADEIIVIDQKSDDKTVEIARKYTDKIFITEPKLICNPDRNFGIDKAANRWVLLVEADEIIDENLRDEIRNILSPPTEFEIYHIPVKTFFVGKWIKHCGWYPSYIPRLFKKGTIIFEENIHTNGKAATDLQGYLKNPILHYSYDSIDDWIDKFKRYTTRMAEESFRKGETPSASRCLWEVFVKPAVIFFRKYILLKGYMEGWRGLFISISASLGGIFAYFKLCELDYHNKK